MRAAGVVGAVVGIWLSIACPARAAAPVVLHLRVEGVINPIKARYVRGALEQARATSADLVLISINTPGGLVSSMQEIIEAITSSPVPVAGLVEPRAAQATSAGAFILLATDVAGLLRDTRVGAAHPVGAGEPLKGAIEQKATNSLASLARSLAARRGRSEAAAEAMVRDSVSYTAEEAKEKQIIDVIVDDAPSFLTSIEGKRLDFPGRHVTLRTKGATWVEAPMSRANRVLDTLADPTIASILMSIGVLGILYELSAPGIGLGGIVGVTSLLLGLLAMSVLPLKAAGLLLVLAGFVAIAVESLSPMHGAIGAGGVAAIALGALVLIDETRYFGSPQRVDLRVFLPVLVLVGLGFIAIARVARAALGKPPQSGIEALRGLRGVAKEPFAGQGPPFAGSVLVDGARWQAVSDSAIGEGEAIEVVEVLKQPTRLRVKAASKGES